MKKETELSRVRKALGTVADTVGKKKGGTFIARREFFYRHGFSAEAFAEKVSKALYASGIEHCVVESYEKWAPFRGGASTAASSHWGVEFEVLPSLFTAEVASAWEIMKEDA